MNSISATIFLIVLHTWVVDSKRSRLNWFEQRTGLIDSAAAGQNRGKRAYNGCPDPNKGKYYHFINKHSIRGPQLKSRPNFARDALVEKIKRKLQFLMLELCFEFDSRESAALILKIRGRQYGRFKSSARSNHTQFRSRRSKHRSSTTKRP